MGFFDRIFGPRKEELAGFSAEAEQVAAERKQVKNEADALFPKDEDDLKQVIPWYEKRIALLQDTRFHPMARLAVTPNFDYMILDYAGKLKDASHGDLKAIREVKDIKAKVQIVIDEEIARLQTRLISLKEKAQRMEEYARGQGARWVAMKEQVKKDIETERERCNLILPRDQNDENQKRAYFREAVARLGNGAIPFPARLTWVTQLLPAEKDKILNEFFAIINKLLAGDNVEEKLHALEGQMKAVVLSEAELIRTKYKQYL